MIWNLKNNQNVVRYVGILLFLFSAFIRFLALNQTPFANGWDGYYYVMQAHSFLEFGHLQSPDYSLIYPYFIFFSWLIPDYELAFKVGTAILSGLFTFSCFRMFYFYSKKSINLALFVASLTIFSSGITFFASQFPKNLLGLIFIAWVIFYLSQKRYFWALLFIILSALSHRMTGGLGLIFLVISILSSISKKYLIFGLTVFIAISFLPGILSFSDMARFQGQFSSVWQFAPISFFKLGAIQRDLIWSIELIISSALCLGFFIYIIIHSIREKKTTLSELILLVLIVLIFFPVSKFAAGSMGYRFFLIIFFLYPFLFGVLLHKKIKKEVLLMVSGLLLAGSFFTYKSYNPYIHDAPNHFYHKLSEKVNEKYNPKQYPLIIVHKSLAEVIIYKTDFDALNWDVPEESEKQKILRVVEGIPFRFIDKYLDENREDVYQLSTLYSVMPEDVWQKILARADDHGDDYFLSLVEQGKNPTEQRPKYLKKGKKL